MLNEHALYFLVGSVLGSYLFTCLIAWLIKFVTSSDYQKRFVIAALITILFGGLLSAFGAGEGGFANRLSIVTEHGLWFVWSQFYGVMAMLGIYFTIKTLFGSHKQDG